MPCDSNPAGHRAGAAFSASPLRLLLAALHQAGQNMVGMIAGSGGEDEPARCVACMVGQGNNCRCRQMLSVQPIATWFGRAP